MEERPKLCYVLWEYERTTDRHYFHIYELLELLAQEIDLYVVSLGGERPEIPGAAGSEVVCKTPHSVRGHKQTYLPGILKTFEVLARLRRAGYKNFFIHYSFPVARRAALFGRLTGARVFLWHSILVHKLLEDVGDGKLAHALHKATFRMVHVLVTSSDYMRRYYEKEFGLPRHRVKVVRASISLERFDPRRFQREEERRKLGYGPGDKVVLWVHGLERGKGCLELPEIASLVRARVPEAFFEVVGDGSRRAEIEAELERRHMSDRVRMRGRVPNVDILPYYVAADLFIMPSRFEEFSRVLLEAMAMGLPFVASDGSGPILGYVSDRQKPWIVPAMRTAEFAQKAALLLQDPAERAALAAHGKEYVRRFSLERARDEFLMEILGVGPRVPSTRSASVDDA